MASPFLEDASPPNVDPPCCTKAADMIPPTSASDDVSGDDNVPEDAVPTSNAEVAEQEGPRDPFNADMGLHPISTQSQSSRKRKLQRPQRARRLSQSPIRSDCNGYDDRTAGQSRTFPDEEDGDAVITVVPTTPNDVSKTPEKVHNKASSPRRSPPTVATRPSSGRIRKPPKTFSKEMDEMYSIAAQKKRKKGDIVSTEQAKQQVPTRVVSQVAETQIMVQTFSANECATDAEAAGSPEFPGQIGLELNLVVVDSRTNFRGDASQDYTGQLLPEGHAGSVSEPPVTAEDGDQDNSLEISTSTVATMLEATDGDEQEHHLIPAPTTSRTQSTDGKSHSKKKAHRKNQWTVPIAPMKMSSSTLSKPESALVVPQDSIGYGDLIWGKMRGFDWWPGLVVSSYQAGQLTSIPPEAQVPGQHGWIRWFGDHQFSPIAHSRVAMFSNFRPLLLGTKKPKNMYRKALFEALEIAAARAQKDFPSEWLAGGRASRSKIAVTEKDEQLLDAFCGMPRQRHLLHWALNGFQPGGADSLRPMEEESDGSTEFCLVSAPAPTMLPPMPSTPAQQYQPVVSQPPTPLAARNTVPRPTQEMINSDSRPGSRQQLEHFAAVRRGEKQLAQLCLCCGETTNIAQEHPLIVGGICCICIPKFIECAYCFDEDGSQTFCTICADGKEVYLCDSPGCARAYCPLCLEKLCGAEIHQHVNKAESWLCFMCQPEQQSGLLRVQNEWHSRLVRLMASDNCCEYEREPAPVPPPLQDRRPLRVLALFDGIGTGMLVLRELGLEIDKYISSEIDPDAVRVARRHHPDIIHVGDVQTITRKQIAEWGPFDLVFGGSPCNDLSLANPTRRGIYEGTGRLFFDFHRLMELARPSLSESRPFFWLYENVVSMRIVDKMTISRFLECNPTVVDAKDVSPAHRPRFFWGNLPGMDRTIVPWPGDTLVLQECLEPNCNRQAKFAKLRTITTKSNSIRQTKRNLFPIHVEGDGIDGEATSEDGLWCTELERIFGFPPHYTDVGNLSRVSRQRLLGRAWSVPVVRHLLAPLKDYFKVVPS